MTKSPQSVIKTIAHTPNLIQLAAADKLFFPGLLESQAGRDDNARYDVLFAYPGEALTATNHIEMNQLLNAIDCVPAQVRSEQPFEQGWLVYLSYESVTCWQSKLSPPSNRQILAAAIYCAGSIVVDRFEDKTYLCGASSAVITAIEERIASLSKYRIQPNRFNFIGVESAEKFQQGIEKCQSYIRRGDIYQANLSRRWYYRSEDSLICPAGLFARLKKANPAPFAALFQRADWAIVSSSPERLFSVKDGLVSTRPIAGTHPRGHDRETDLMQINRLTRDDKERAEHIMLVDLERNDIGQVCRAGTVNVNELMVVETYPHVHHIVSNVQGQLKPEVMMSDVIKALFPGGTITGCPKIRCMQIIAEIEQRSRGAYTGSIGYINHHGQADFNILIRTLFVTKNDIFFNAGAGIVHDSNPQKETAETEHKAEGMIRALSS